MACHFVAGHQVGKEILDALGIPGEGVTRVVVDLQLREIAKVYITKHLPAEAVPAIAEAVKDAEVIQANVTIDPITGNVVRMP